MEAPLVSAADEVNRSRDYLSDLVSITARPARSTGAWSDCEHFIGRAAWDAGLQNASGIAENIRNAGGGAGKVRCGRGRGLRSTERISALLSDSLRLLRWHERC